MRLFVKLTIVELKLFVREPVSLVFTFLFPVVVLVVLAGVFGSTPAYEFDAASPVDYYQASYMAVVIGAMSLVAVPVHVATYRERGVLRRLRASSVPASSVIGAQLVVALLLISAGAVLLMIVGALAYDTNPPERPGPALAGFVLAAASFLALGFLIGNLARNARAAQAIGMLLFFPMWLLSGAGPPPDVLSDGMRRVADLLPLTYAVRAIKDPWLGNQLPLTAVAVLATMLVASVAWSTRAVRQV
jgi:ABC-2 type transport system permease protein